MSTLEEKILNGPTINYCSSSEDEGGNDFERQGECLDTPTQASGYGISKNTGPKGVKQDYYEHLQLKKDEEKIKHDILIAEAKKFNISSSQNCESESEDELIKMRMKRLEEMKKRTRSLVKNLETADDYLNTIENSRNCLSIIHIYKKNCDICEDLDTALITLSTQFPSHKFFRIESYILPTSEKFKLNASPTIQIYYNESLVGNFIRFDNNFNDDITPEKIVLFLKKHDILLSTNIEADDDY
uniref:Phosducin domain-containing protein n=1 Tax=Parastrongyloides trichosuri TaxID=131310 RepID=A0A0N4ZN54_PARTI